MNLQLMLKLLHTLEQLRKRERWTRSQLYTYQEEALRRLRQYAYTRSPFYQGFHKGLTGRPLHELPVLTKAVMMENFDRSCSRMVGSKNKPCPPPTDGDSGFHQSLAHVLTGSCYCEELVAPILARACQPAAA